MTVVETQFYHTSGTLRPDAPSYVTRQADIDLHHGLTRGEFCYVLTSRQMGKSSLMARTAANLRREGLAVVPLDLTGVGQNLSPDQWYDGLLAQMGAALDVEDDLDDFWADRARLGPLQRWMSALRQVVLPRVPGRVVVFVDEIDAVRSLPFSTDEFFAGIRECYNRRSDDPEYARLTFCLLGVASPSDLIRDVRTTPFNIGRRIELSDFTEAEAAPLAAGLPASIRAPVSKLQRILYWTGGHPYLTQRLCHAVAASGNITTLSDVDELCRELFLTHRARERDDNLLLVRDRLLHSEEDRARMLSLYGRVRSPRQKVPDDETNQLVTRLWLAGVVREHEGSLRVRNRIYARVFNTAWVTSNMPDAELRRLRSVARQEAKRRRLAEERERATRRNLYVAEMGLAHQALTTANVPRALELLARHRRSAGHEELRGFEWSHLWHEANRDDSEETLSGHGWVVRSVAFSPDGGTLASTGSDHSLRLWDLRTARPPLIVEGDWGPIRFSHGGDLLISGSGRTILLRDPRTGSILDRLEAHSDGVAGLAVSPNNELLASASVDGTVKIWEIATRKLLATLEDEGFLDIASSPSFSPDSKTLATSSADGAVRLWDLPTMRERGRIEGLGEVASVAYSPDGTQLALGMAYTGNVALWEVAGGRLTAILDTHAGTRVLVAFSPDGSVLAAGGSDGKVRLWNAQTGQERAVLAGHQRAVTALAFSPDGRRIASGSWDHTIKLWRASATSNTILRGGQPSIWRLAISACGSRLAVAGGDGSVGIWNLKDARELAVLKGHTNFTEEIVLSPDGSLAMTVGPDRTTRVWDVDAAREVAVLTRETTDANHALALSPDGALLARGGENHAIHLWDVRTREDVAILRGHAGHIAGLAFSPDGRILASGSGPPDGTVKLWDLATLEEIGSFAGSRSWMAPVAFSPDGKRLATGVGMPDYTIKIWDLASRREQATLSRHSGQIAWIGFSPDGRTLASVSHDDHTLKLWSLSSGTEVITFHDPKMAAGAAFSPDGSALVTARRDGTLRVWRATPLAEAEAQLRAREPARRKASGRR
jgi:WD40 repeat protein